VNGYYLTVYQFKSGNASPVDTTRVDSNSSIPKKRFTSTGNLSSGCMAKNDCLVFSFRRKIKLFAEPQQIRSGLLRKADSVFDTPVNVNKVVILKIEG